MKFICECVCVVRVVCVWVGVSVKVTDDRWVIPDPSDSWAWVSRIYQVAYTR